MNQIILSRVAERVYWMARYLERVENTARLVTVYTDLLLDLPRGVDLSWYNLVVLNSATDTFLERYTRRDERNVLKFMLADANNPNSMSESLRMARENARTSRDVVPEATWEFVNELYLYVQKNINQGINRGSRHQFSDDVIKACHQISGLFSNSMSKDPTSEFLRLGRTLERADMATRILDAGAAATIDAEQQSLNLPQIVWTNVLNSVDAYQPYLRVVGGPVSGDSVAEFLLENNHFPRSVNFCMKRMENAITRLPRGDMVKLQAENVCKSIEHYTEYSRLGESFRNHLNDLQLKLATLHRRFEDTWFALD